MEGDRVQAVGQIQSAEVREALREPGALESLRLEPLHQPPGSRRPAAADQPHHAHV